ncbi:hypothetical protein PISMIDRAFT_8188 [Pisolithus microcarpus 441]|uniref:Uncharacterized protein n=1 Tax=Pisolithus microcarpus 441 TaxID=765257 RepID=A0A0C9YQL1_9AGAM|nr:hypothetical protein PISMIDRAFT_8188 [Pisolithus microcarpus 441]
MAIAIEGAPPLNKVLWCLLTASSPAVRQWDGFKVLVTLQYPEIEPVEDILECFEEFQSCLRETHHNKLSSVEALGDYLHIFQLWFLGMLEVLRRLTSRYPLFRSGLLWPIKVIVCIMKEVIKDGKKLPGKLKHEAHLSFHLQGIPLNFEVSPLLT